MVPRRSAVPNHAHGHVHACQVRHHASAAAALTNAIPFYAPSHISGRYARLLARTAHCLPGVLQIDQFTLPADRHVARKASACQRPTLTSLRNVLPIVVGLGIQHISWRYRSDLFAGFPNSDLSKRDLEVQLRRKPFVKPTQDGPVHVGAVCGQGPVLGAGAL